MKRVTVARSISSPISDVFKAITEVEKLPDTNPDVVAVEFLTDSRSGAGTRFRETRAGKGKHVVTELEVTEQVENSHARFVSDMGGTVWDTLFSFQPEGSPPGSATRLEIQLDAKPYKLLPRIVTPFIMGMVRKGMEAHIDSVKEYCEGLPAE